MLAGTPNTPYQYSATIPLDVTPQRFARTAAANAGAAAVELDLRDATRQVTLAVSRAFFDAVLSEERLRIARERRVAVAQVLQSDSIRFHAGDVAERNIARSEIELVRSDADIARATVDVQDTRLALQLAMGVEHPESGVAVRGPLEYRRLELPSDSLVAMARAHRSDLAAANTRVVQSDDARRTAAALVVPTPQLSFVRQYSAPFESGHYYSLGLSFELPVLNQYGAERERAAAGVTTARIAARRTASQIERDVSAAVIDFRMQRDLVEHYRDGAVAKSEAGVDAARYAYSRGATSLLEVLDALRTAQDVRTEYVTALHDYWVSAYALNAAVGTDVLGAAVR